MNRRNLILIGYGFDEVTTDYVRQTIFHLEKNNFVVSVNLLNRQESFFLKQLFTTGRIGPFFHEWSANHYQYTPQRILPFARFELIKKINICIDIIIIFVFSFLKRKINVKSKKILWIFHPWVFTHYFLDIKFIFNCSLYDCVDYYNDEIFDEKKICSAVDLVVVNSQTLYKKLSKFKRKMILVVQGFDHKLFSSSIDNNIVKKSIIKTIGYVGGINNRLDYELLYSLVISNPQIRFVFCGPIFDITFSQKKIFEKITAKKNVLHFSRKKLIFPV